MKTLGVFAAIALVGSVACSSKNDSSVGTNDSGVLSCNKSVAQYCSSSGPDTCDHTWSAAQTDMALCPAGASGYAHTSEYDCGGYHALRQVLGIDSESTSYYDSSSGELIAIVDDGNGGMNCNGGPSIGFTPPTCAAASSLTAPPQCAVDGGDDSSKNDSGASTNDSGVLSCNMSVAQYCSSSGPDTCDHTWSAAQTDLALCTAGAGGYHHTYEYDCGGYYALRQVDIDSGSTFYYDGTSGALIAIVDDGLGETNCGGGPSTGFVPPTCSAAASTTLPPQCAADGGVDGANP
jgi:hypothetical protein